MASVVIANRQNRGQPPGNKTTAAQWPGPASDPPKAWNDAPLHAKASLSVLLAAVGGSVIGMLVESVSGAIWPLWFGLVALVGGLLVLVRCWICRPFEQLLSQLDRIIAQDLPTGTDRLPLHRRDEVGRLARGIDRCMSDRRRDYHEVKRLRRVLDRRVEHATRRATHALRKMAMHDPLTGLGNRRFLDEHLELLVGPARASVTGLVCIAIDIDNFKAVNDTLGHAAGDDLLRVVAELIRGNKRHHEDYGVRMGGDEFVVLMPGCGLERARLFGARMTSLFGHHARTVLPSGLWAGLSVGIASMTGTVTTGQQLLAAADLNLYRAKRAGTGRVAGGEANRLMANGHVRP